MASSSSGHGYVGSELPPSSADSAPRAADQLKVRHDLSSQTVFRLHILGRHNWDKSQIDEARVEQLVQKAFDVTPDAKIMVKSLADHPVRQALVATLNFSEIPTRISQTSPPLQEFDGTADELSLDLDTHFHGFTPLHSGISSERTCDFIALSGLGGHAFGSFKRRGGDFMWLRDDLPVSVPGSRVFIYGYDTQLLGSTSFQSLEDLGLAFKNALKSLLRESSKCRFMKPLILLGHSLGGLILKEALCQMSANSKVDDEALLKSIRAILFFGTPNQGMDITSLIPMVEGQANENFLLSLGTDSADLRRQAQQWSKAFDSTRSSLLFNDLEIISYYETCTSRTATKGLNDKWKMSGPHVTLVNRSSATHGRPWETDEHFVHPIDRDHSGLVKFRHRNDPVYVSHVLPRLQSSLDDHEHEQRQLYLTEEQKVCLLSLNFPDRTSRQDQIMTARDTTCEWLLQHQKYISWIQGSEGLLWLEGHPGSGKSTLTKHAVDAMNDNTSSRNVVLTHFFHGRGSEIQKSALGMVRSLTYQLLINPTIRRNFSACWTDIWRKYHGNEYHTWKLEWLYAFLERQFRRACAVQPIVIFIDALDECEEEDRDYLGDFLTNNVRESVGGRLKIFVSCRHYPNLFSEGCRVQTEINNADDIAIFVESKLRVMQEKKRSVLAEEIISNARGNFQWAHIVTRQSITLHRKGRTAFNIQEQIRQLPKDIHELYDSLFKDADAEDLQLAYRLFHWLCFAGRSPSIRELQYAIMLSPDAKESSIKDIRRRTDFREELSDMVNTITYISRGLAEFPVSDTISHENLMDPDNHHSHSNLSWSSTVQLIHQTAIDYLLETGLQTLEGGRHKFSRGQSNYFISRSCLHYVLMEDFAEESQHPDTLINEVGTNALHDYIYDFLGSHLLEVDSEDIDQSDFIVRLGWPHNRYRLENFAIAIGARPFLETFLSGQPPSESSPNQTGYYTLLHWAVGIGLAGMVKFIAQCEFDQFREKGRPGRPSSSILSPDTSTLVNQKLFVNGYFNTNVQDFYGLSALERAISENDASIVQELMKSPVLDPNFGNYMGRAPLQQAILRSSRSEFLGEMESTRQIVRNLLEHPRIDTRLQDFRGRTALFDAADRNDLEILQMNVDVAKSCVNVRDVFGYTPLAHAAMIGHVDAVKIFVDCGHCTRETLQSAYDGIVGLNDECMQILIQTGLVESRREDAGIELWEDEELYHLIFSHG